MRKTFQILIIVIIAFGIIIASFCRVERVKSVSGKITVVLDAGHGGIDAGVVASNGVKESDLNLDICSKIKKRLLDNCINVVMTRKDIGGLYGFATKGFKQRDMKKRKEIIENSGAKLVVSIHINKCPFPYRKGAQVFYKIGEEKSKNFANFLQLELNKMPYTDKDNASLVGDYYILNCTQIPSVLVECGFFSNPQDEKLLLSQNYREGLAGIISQGILTFLLGQN